MERGCESLSSAEKGVNAYLVQCANSHRTGLPFQQMKTGMLSNKEWAVNVSNVPNSPVYGRRFRD